MRTKVHGSRRAKPKPLSLFPEQIRFATKRTLHANISFSKYVQVLIELDERKDLLAEALTSRLLTKAA